ncbi:hypothetical protein NQT69_11100 [Pseudoalteromonas shioyasakiensis]|uniref:hypothetical protein n=1 Tax=Pseudoalteromonas shioyasakiensis TaxID=1190813 RepID=UPI00211822B4|nr:hypothetical protein [Pseudoalteromonas shioyasakiensis]MCQ8878549.1 hypothetical protein [Pseudoalteromonas shioyasakiensis]
MKQSVLLILAFLLLQPLLDSFDVADYNHAIKTTAQLLKQQTQLDSHCSANNDHDLHQSEHLQLNQAIAENLDEAHCHVCHISILFSQSWENTALLPSSDTIALAQTRFVSRLITPDLRPPIVYLLS